MGVSKFDEFGMWLLDDLLEGSLRSLFVDNLQAFGIAATTAVLLAPVCAYFAVKLFWKVLEPAPEPAWHLLNPDDQPSVRQAFDDLHTVARLANRLGENAAETIEQFQTQLRRLGLYGKYEVWERLDPNDDELVEQLYYRPNVAAGVAKRLNDKTAKTTEQFRAQLRRLQMAGHASRESE